MIKKTKTLQARPTPQASTRDREPQKSAWMDDYLNVISMKMHPVSESLLETLAVDVLAWARTDEDALKISQFYLSKGICQETWNRWTHKNANLMKAHKTALALLGNRREIGAMKKGYDPKMVMFSMPFYDPEWKEAEEWRAKMRDEQKEADNAQRIVVIERFPDSDLVPKKELK